MRQFVPSRDANPIGRSTTSRRAVVDAPGKTQGEIEAAVCDVVRHLEMQFTGREPGEVRAHLIGDLIVARARGVLTVAERRLVASACPDRGSDLLKLARTSLIESVRPLVKAVVEDITDVEMVSLYYDICGVADEEVFILGLAAPPA